MLDKKVIKRFIEEKTLSNYLIVFLDTDSFIITQYIRAIAEYKNKQIVYVDNLDMFMHCNKDIFDLDDIDDNMLYVYKTTNLDCTNIDILQQKNLFIIADSITAESKQIFDNNILHIAKLENWCIKDYAYSNMVGVKPADIDWLLNITKYNIYRIDQEISKFKLFKKSERQAIFDNYKLEYGFDDLSMFTIFNFTNAIITKDKIKIKLILNQLKHIDVNAIGLITLLHDNFKNIINIQLNPASTPATCNLTQKQYNAIKYNCGYYSSKQLISVLKILDEVDIKLKTGYLPVDQIIDYIILKILGV